MLTYLAHFAEDAQIFNVFRYITFRTGAAMITSFIVVFLFGPSIIATLRIRQGRGQPIRADGPQTHFKKAGTPTMGGLMILSGVIAATLIWADLRNLYVWAVLLVTVGFGAIGFYDDYLKVTKQSHKGFSGKARLALEFLIAGIASAIIVYAGSDDLATSIPVPFFKQFLLDIGIFYIGFAAFVMVGAGNAVNLTDGLDGLAIVPIMIAAAALGLPGTGNFVGEFLILIGSFPGAPWIVVLAATVGFVGSVTVARFAEDRRPDHSLEDQARVPGTTDVPGGEEGR